MRAQCHGLQRLQYAPAASNALTRKVDERDRSKPILAFFASKYIEPGEEITSACSPSSSSADGAVSYSGDIPTEEEQEAAMARQRAGGKPGRRKSKALKTAGLPTPDQSDDDHALKVCRCGHPACFGYVFRPSTSDDDD